MASREKIGELYDRAQADLTGILAKHADADQQERVDFLRAARTGNAPSRALLQNAFLMELCAILATVVDAQESRILALEAKLKAGKHA